MKSSNSSNWELDMRTKRCTSSNFRIHTSYILVAEVGRMAVVLGEGAVDWGRGTEPHVGAEVVATSLAVCAHPAGHTWLYGNPVPCIVCVCL